MAEWDFSRLLDEVVDGGLVDYTSYREFPEDLVASLAQAFSVYKMNAELIRHDERVFLADLVDEARTSGAYSEVPLTDVEAVREQSALRTKGVLHVETDIETGVKRFYNFDVETHPDLLRYNEFYDEAKTRLIQRVLGLLKDR